MSSEKSFFNGSAVDELTPEDFDRVVTWKLKQTKCTAVLFYAPWCPHCSSIKNDWIKFAETAVFMNVAGFNCDKYSSHLAKIKEDMPNLVKGFPTIIYYVTGKPSESFEGERTFSNMLKKGMAVCQRYT